MKKRKTAAFCALLLCAALTAALPASAVDASQQTVLLQGTLHWDDEENVAGLRPEAVTVRLMRDGVTEAETTAAADDWTFSFEVTAGTVASYTVAAEAPTGYEENTNAHLDPTVRHTDASVGGWTKYEPCNALEIPAVKLSASVIAGKMTAHQPAVIWTPEALTAEEQSAVWSALQGQPGVGNPPSVVYISGDGASQYGMTVSAADGVVNFEQPSDWALLYGADFAPVGDAVQGASITFAWTPLLDPVPGDGQYDTPEPEPQPEFGTEPEEDIPPVLDDTPKQDEPPAPDNTPIIDTTPEEIIPPKQDETPAPDNTPIIDTTPEEILPPKQDETPAPDNTPIFDITPEENVPTVETPQPTTGNVIHTVILPAPQHEIIRDAAAQIAEKHEPAGGGHALDAQPKTGLTPAYYVCGALLAVSALGLTALGATALLKKRSR